MRLKMFWAKKRTSFIVRWRVNTLCRDVLLKCTLRSLFAAVSYTGMMGAHSRQQVTRTTLPVHKSPALSNYWRIAYVAHALWEDVCWQSARRNRAPPPPSHEIQPDNGKTAAAGKVVFSVVLFNLDTRCHKWVIYTRLVGDATDASYHSVWAIFTCIN